MSVLQFDSSKKCLDVMKSRHSAARPEKTSLQLLLAVLITLLHSGSGVHMHKDTSPDVFTTEITANTSTAATAVRMCHWQPINR